MPGSVQLPVEVTQGALSAITAGVFLLLALGCIVALYAFRLQPTTRRQRVYVAITIGFLAWMLLSTVALR